MIRQETSVGLELGSITFVDSKIMLIAPKRLLLYGSKIVPKPPLNQEQIYNLFTQN